MFTMGMYLFGFYGLLILLDEFIFHRGQQLQMEKIGRFLNTFLLASGFAVTLFFEYSNFTRILYLLLMLTSCLAFPLFELGRETRKSGERYLHAVLYMLHPPVWALLLGIWMFIDGAGFFTKIVLPFSTKNLRPLCWGFFAATSTFLAYQLFFHLIIRRNRGTSHSTTEEVIPPSQVA